MSIARRTAAFTAGEDVAARAEDAVPEAPEGDHAAATLLQRVILPRYGDPLDLRTLYVDEDSSNTRRSRPSGRTSLRIPSESEVSFATYFNAFPASYWRRWTVLEAVQLRVRVSGECRVDVYRSKSDGSPIHADGRVVAPGTQGAATDEPVDLTLSLDLAPFEDGGWYWFDITSESGEVELHAASWHAPEPAPGRAAVSVGMTTFNRPEDCVNALSALGEDPEVLRVLSAVIVADQGNRNVVHAPGYAAAAEALGSRLRIHYQGNLGGSGGFARGMFEAVEHTDCEQVLLLDDDILVEPDSVLRAVAFSRFAEQPTLVGGQMLNLVARSHLHSMGEVVDREKFMWRGAPNVTYDHDFAKYPLRESTELHRRIDVDYNGWWMCLIPRSVIEAIGMPLPLFIKWDDAEYSLRAAEAGYPTATVPGVAIWHMPWSDKDDATDWQAYFHLRNRLVVAALHTPHPRGGGLLRDNLKATLKHLLTLQYSTVALHHMAIDDFLAGPDSLFEELALAITKVRALRAEYPDGAMLPSARELPLPSMDPVHAERFLQPPSNPATIGATLAASMMHNVLPAKAEHHRRPQLNIAAQDARWFLLSRLDGATVANSDGTGVSFRKRDPRTFWSLLRISVRKHITLARQFPRMRKEYRRALPEITSRTRWSRVFGDTEQG